MHHKNFKVLNVLDQYVIPLKGLKEGKSIFSFKVDNQFFEHFGNPEIGNGNLLADFVLNKTLSLIEMEISISGELEVACDRCLESFFLPTNTKNKLFVKIGDGIKEEDAEIIYVSDFGQLLNIAQYIFEYIDFGIPLKKIHPNDENGNSLCNKQMLEKINELSKKQSINGTDPRWDGLSELRGK